MTIKNNYKDIILSAPIVLADPFRVIADGALLVSGEKIKDIGTADEVISTHPDITRRHFDDSILMPGLINAHIHLEYSALGALDSPMDFIPWIKELITRQKMLSESAVTEAISSAINGLISSGVTSVCEVSRSGLSLDGLIKSGMKGVFSLEIVAIDDELKKARFKEFITLFENSKCLLSASTMRAGIFPHSVYTLSENVLREARAFCSAKKVICGIHAAESADEAEFVASGSGALADFVRAFGLDTAPKPLLYKDTVEYLDALGFLNPMTCLVHLAHIDEAEFPLIASRGTGIVLCPRSNHLLNNGAFPFIASLEHDLKIALGTDSLASNTSLDMFEEMRFLSESVQNEVRAKGAESHINQKILHIATAGGAEVLGIGSETGSLTLGRSADIIAVGGYDPGGGISPVDYLVAMASGSDVTFTMIDGDVRHDSSS